MNKVEFKITINENEARTASLNSDEIVKSFLHQNPGFTCEKISELSDDEIIDTILNDDDLFSKLAGGKFNCKFNIEFV